MYIKFNSKTIAFTISDCCRQVDIRLFFRVNHSATFSSCIHLFLGLCKCLRNNRTYILSQKYFILCLSLSQEAIETGEASSGSAIVVIAAILRNQGPWNCLHGVHGRGGSLGGRALGQVEVEQRVVEAADPLPRGADRNRFANSGRRGV